MVKPLTSVGSTNLLELFPADVRILTGLPGVSPIFPANPPNLGHVRLFQGCQAFVGEERNICQDEAKHTESGEIPAFVSWIGC